MCLDIPTRDPTLYLSKNNSNTKFIKKTNVHNIIPSKTFVWVILR